MPFAHVPLEETHTENPENVCEALRELREAGIWKDTQAKEIRAKIREVAVRKMANFRAKTKPKLKAKPKAATRVIHSDDDETPPTTKENKAPPKKSTARGSSSAGKPDSDVELVEETPVSSEDDT